MPQDPEPLWTLDDMANFLRISKVTLYRMVKKGDVPHVRVGKKIYFIKAGVQRWLEAKQRGGKIGPSKK
jgi:putative molybdopterin biosynthesis protein